MRASLLATHISSLLKFKKRKLVISSCGSLNSGFAAGFSDHEVTGPLLSRPIEKTYVHTAPPCLYTRQLKETN